MTKELALCAQTPLCHPFLSHSKDPRAAAGTTHARNGLRTCVMIITPCVIIIVLCDRRRPPWHLMWHRPVLRTLGSRDASNEQTEDLAEHSRCSYIIIPCAVCKHTHIPTENTRFPEKIPDFLDNYLPVASLYGSKKALWFRELRACSRCRRARGCAS